MVLQAFFLLPLESNHQDMQEFDSK